MKRLLLLGTPFAGGALALALTFAPRPGVAPAVPMSGSMPSVDGPAVGGGSIRRSDYSGQVLVLNFWASWCAPCREEQPGLERLWRDYRGRGVRVLGINSRDLESDALAHIAEFDVTYPSVSDPTGHLMGRFDVAYLPATVLVDAEGRLRLRLPGARTEDELQGLLHDLLRGTPT